MSTGQSPGDIPYDPRTLPPMGGAQDGAPVSPLSAMAAEAVVMHVIFESYLAAGFNHSQATYLCGVVLAESVRKAP